MGKAKIETIDKWKKANVKQYLFYVNRNTEGDIIEWLDSMPSKRQYLVEIIRKDMKNAAKKTAKDRQTKDDGKGTV